MNFKYQVWRYHHVIHQFRNIQELKKWMLESGEFKGYEKKIRKATLVRAKNFSFEKWDLNWVCCMTEYCSLKILDNRKTKE